MFFFRSSYVYTLKKYLITLFLLTCLMQIYSQSTSNLVLPPDIGHQNKFNNYKMKKVLVYKQDFENGWEELVNFGEGAHLTRVDSEVLAGQQSVRMSASDTGVFFIPEHLLSLQPYETYYIEYDYKFLSDASKDAIPLGVGIYWPELESVDNLIGGLVYGKSPDQGSSGYSIRIGNTHEAAIYVYNSLCDIVVDNIAVYRLDKSIEKASIPFVKNGFPRLSLYSLESPLLIAMINDGRVDEIIDTMSYYDMINGGDFDHTFGYAGWQDQLRKKNPDIRLLHYFESFIAQHLEREVFAGSAGLFAFFNRGLIEEWFVHKPNGERMNEFLYPQNYQLNHTSMGPRVQGWSLIDYSGYFLSHSVQPSGLWDGIHFDQSDWTVNSLLAEDRFGPPPPIDLDYDGVEEERSVLYTEWKKAYINYFNFMQHNIGNSKLFFGNTGHIASNPTMLGFLNGWLQEMVTPYNILQNGDWDTNSPGGWYDLVNNYFCANRYARGPQINSMQFTGMGLGTPLPRLTPNSIPDRVQELEPRDFQRMRLGLTTALLGNGFFGYDFIDNTSLPVWFDEFAVNEQGVAEKSFAAKGYLGQPLNDGHELPWDKEVVFNVDFETIPETGKYRFLGDFEVTNKPEEVISGGQSIIFNYKDMNQYPIAFDTDPNEFPLEVGEIYHFSADYKILEHNPTRYALFFALGIIEKPEDINNAKLFSSMYYLDVDGPGQTGKLRAVLKVNNPNAKVVINFQDTGKVVFDNIKLEKGTGGVWRRDYEKGIVLINPTPLKQTLSINQIRGDLNRTNIKRIKGTQDPAVNNGLPVTSSMTLPVADGIILLADEVNSTSPGKPGTPHLEGAIENLAVVSWPPANGTVAGYHIVYGKDQNHLNQEAATGPDNKIELKFLDQGSDYYLKVCSYDFLGNFSEFSDVIHFKTKGSTPSNVPVIDINASSKILIPGDYFYLSGNFHVDNMVTLDQAVFPLEISTLTVNINGIKAPLVHVSENSVIGIVPWKIVGDEVLISVTYDKATSPLYKLKLQQSNPKLSVWSDDILKAFHGTDQSAVLPDNPAIPGEEITLLVSSIGLVEPPPADGYNVIGSVKTDKQCSVIINDEIIIDQVSIKQYHNLYGNYSLTFTLPEDLPKGNYSIKIKIGENISTSGALFGSL